MIGSCSRAVAALLVGFVTLAWQEHVARAAPPGARALLQADEQEGYGAADDDYADTDPSALTDFRATLDPHGAWVDDPDYGTVWVPNPDEVGPDFAPYVSNGQWQYDDQDYVWNSDYGWGWAVFHYGRWAWIDSGRWGWIPGRAYAGAWVSWWVGADGYGYVGWGPIQPVYVWRGGAAVGFSSGRPGPAVFAPRDGLFARGVGSQVVSGPRAVTVASGAHPYVPANPVVGGVASPRGPAPSSLGIGASTVVRVSPNDRGLLRARGFSRPSTAQAWGAPPPGSRVVRVNRSSGPRPVLAAPRASSPPPGGAHRR